MCLDMLITLCCVSDHRRSSVEYSFKCVHQYDSTFVTNPSSPTPMLICRVLRSNAMQCLVDLLLLVKADLTWSHIYQKQQTTNNGENLEKVVLGEVLQRVVWVELHIC